MKPRTLVSMAILLVSACGTEKPKQGDVKSASDLGCALTANPPSVTSVGGKVTLTMQVKGTEKILSTKIDNEDLKSTVGGSVERVIEGDTTFKAFVVSAKNESFVCTVTVKIARVETVSAALPDADDPCGNVASRAAAIEKALGAEKEQEIAAETVELGTDRDAARDEFCAALDGRAGCFDAKTFDEELQLGKATVGNKQFIVYLYGGYDADIGALFAQTKAGLVRFYRVEAKIERPADDEKAKKKRAPPKIKAVYVPLGAKGDAFPGTIEWTKKVGGDGCPEPDMRKT